MAKKPREDAPSIHPQVRDLLDAADHGAFGIAGYVGPAPDGKVRLYADLSLRTYVEVARSDVVRVVESDEQPQGPSVLYLERDADVTYVQTATMTAD